MMGNLNADEIEDVLRSEVIGRIACVAPDDWPYIVPVTYVYDGGEFVFAHSADGEKVEAMRRNPRVCFEVEQIRSVTNWRTVIARGRYEELPRDAEERAMDLLAGKFAWVRPGGPPPDRHEESHRRAGVVRPVLFRIQLLERFGRFALS
jgi:nitroimidazol reductase NimA-like FMN-containing flavoprotein (pyridoxamine 5'-phosphate oxidase superfamily)